MIVKLKYEFKLFCNLVEPPILRFESKGPTHLNREDNIPLHERKISTPHFHIFDDDGFSKAYKIEEIKKVRPDLDIDLALILFFKEALISCVTGGLRVSFQPALT